MELVIVALAAFAVWLILRSILPFRVPERLTPLAIGGIAYGVYLIPSHAVQIALASVAGVFLLSWLTADVDVPDPWKLRLPRAVVQRLEVGLGAIDVVTARKRKPEEPSGQGYRPGGRRGRRIPTL